MTRRTLQTSREDASQNSAMAWGRDGISGLTENLVGKQGFWGEEVGLGDYKYGP